MSFARAFSKRRTQRDITPPSSPLKRAASTVNKHQISSPVELISTTNMLSYTAPSLRTSVSKTSFDSSASSHSSSTVPPLTPDLGVLTPPSTPPADVNHQTYFIPRSSSVSSKKSAEEDAPPLPTLSVRRSNTLSTTTTTSPVPPPKSLSRSSSVSSTHRPSKNPFGPELAKVSELAEEMGLDLDEEHMQQHGLVKFSVNEYMAEVEAVSWEPQPQLWI